MMRESVAIVLLIGFAVLAAEYDTWWAWMIYGVVVAAVVSPVDWTGIRDRLHYYNTGGDDDAPVEGIEQWYEDHCYAPDDCVVDGVSVDLSELFGLLGIGGDDE